MITPEEMKGIEFLNRLGGPHLDQLARMARLRECEEGEVVFRQGEGSALIYFVLSGKVGLQVGDSSGTSVEVSAVGPGELLGWSPVLGRHAMTATAHAVGRCRLAVLDVRQVLDLCERDPRFGAAFLWQTAQALSERLWDTRRNLARALRHQPALATAAEGSD
jgi:CRP-like cAMP-binding protein